MSPREVCNVTDMMSVQVEAHVGETKRGLRWGNVGVGSSLTRSFLTHAGKVAPPPIFGRHLASTPAPSVGIALFSGAAIALASLSTPALVTYDRPLFVHSPRHCKCGRVHST